ncbi:hypothetical protein HN958_02960 [Candidatus Falkowbacteria bacterium]|jgi:hypothetical protein|nr:hypothetical protein [Candidatus Falkowbacteria bacterium]MBT7007439.1 hypothetical protein [Candidatus Falkowbacteria bacterium]
MAVAKDNLIEQQILQTASYLTTKATYFPKVALNMAIDQVLGKRASQIIKNNYFGVLISAVKKINKEYLEALEKERKKQAERVTQEKQKDEKRTEQAATNERNLEKESWKAELSRLATDFPNMNPEDYNEEFYAMVKDAYDEQRLDEVNKESGVERFRMK